MELKEIELYSRKGAVFVERLDRTIGNLFEKVVSERINATFIDKIDGIVKNITKHLTIKTTPAHTSLKQTEEYVHKKVMGKGKSLIPKFKVDNSVKTADE